MAFSTAKNKRMKEDFLGVFKKELVELGEVESQRPPGATAAWRSGPARLWTNVPPALMGRPHFSSKPFKEGFGRDILPGF